MCQTTCPHLHSVSFGLHHDHPELFFKSQWPWPVWVYIIYRAAVAIYLLCWCILSGLETMDNYDIGRRRFLWFIYLTNWSFILLTLNAVLRLLITSYDYHKSRTNKREDGAPARMTWYLKLTWLLYNVSSNAGLVVTIGYWALLFHIGDEVKAVTVNVHAINSLYILLDILITATPIRLAHFFHGLIFGAIYLSFSGVYYALGGTNGEGDPYIYSILDWRDASTACTYGFVLLLTGTPIMWTIIYGVYRGRLLVFKRIYGDVDVAINGPLLPRHQELDNPTDELANGVIPFLDGI